MADRVTRVPDGGHVLSCRSADYFPRNGACKGLRAIAQCPGGNPDYLETWPRHLVVDRTAGIISCARCAPVLRRRHP